MISESGVQRLEDEWFDGGKIDLVTTSFTEGFHDAVGITWVPGASMTEKRESLRRWFGETDRRMIIAYEFAGENRGDYAPPAKGDVDDTYRQFARALVDLGMGGLVHRSEPQVQPQMGEQIGEGRTRKLPGRLRALRSGNAGRRRRRLLVLLRAGPESVRCRPGSVARSVRFLAEWQGSADRDADVL